jgi:hypothetical protein
MISQSGEPEKFLDLNECAAGFYNLANPQMRVYAFLLLTAFNQLKLVGDPTRDCQQRVRTCP